MLHRNRILLQSLAVRTVLLAVSFTYATEALSQTINSVDVRLEGTNVFYRSTPDSVFARVAPGVPFSIIWSCESAETLGLTGIPMLLYSPDGSVTNITWNSPVTPTAAWSAPNVFTLGGAQFNAGPDGFDGTLPSSFLTAGAVLDGSAGFGPTMGAVDILVGNVTVSQEGVLCVDSALFTFTNPSGEWLFFGVDLYGVGDYVDVTWGGLVGGYPDGGFCFEIANCNSCDMAGDANDDGMTNISDVSYLINWIFGGGADPPCLRQADANGDGKNQVGDVVWLIGRIFSNGPQPVCGP